MSNAPKNKKRIHVDFDDKAIIDLIRKGWAAPKIAAHFDYPLRQLELRCAELRRANGIVSKTTQRRARRTNEKTVEAMLQELDRDYGQVWVRGLFESPLAMTEEDNVTCMQIHAAHRMILLDGAAWVPKLEARRRQVLRGIADAMTGHQKGE